VSRSSYVGLETRLDEFGRELAWKAVASETPPSIDAEAVFGLPGSVRYVSPPEDSRHGDLRLIPNTIEQGVAQLSREIQLQGVSTVVMSQQHADGAVQRLLEWNGLRVELHDIDFAAVPVSKEAMPQSIEEMLLLSAQTGERS
jgi:hypothetical protein